MSELKTNAEFVGLKSKMYSMKNNDDKESNTTKELNTATDFYEFKDILFNKKVVRQKMRRIQSKKHKIDDKRFVLDDDIHTLAYFHKDCKKQKDVLKDSHR